MKVLAIILSIATIILSSYPCCQKSESCSGTVFIDQCEDGGSEEIPLNDHGPCSPFYSCGSCSGFTSDYKTFDLIFFVHMQEPFPIPYNVLLPEEVYFYSLKPPQNFEV